MNPSRKPSWRVVTQRLARAIVALRQAAAVRHDLVEQLGLELADELARTSRRWRGPSRPDRRRPSARRRPAAPSRAPPTGAGRSAPSPPRRQASAARSSAGGQRARAPRAAARRRYRSAAGQSTRPWRATRSARRPEDGRRGAERRADEEPGLPDAVVAPAEPRGRIRSPRRHAAADPSSTGSTSGNASPKIRSASSRTGATSPVVELRCARRATRLGRRGAAARRGAAVPRVACRRLEAVDREQLDERRRGGRRRVHDRDPLAGDRGDDRPEERIVGAAEEERVDPGRRRQREDELAGRVALAEQRRQRLGDDRLDLRPAEPAGLDERARTPASRARRPRPPGSRP